MSGINVTCFAYGTTGSGKTHTILGDIYNTSTGEAGISALAITEIFNRVNADPNHSYEMKMSYFEIYNEHVKDLLSDEYNDKLCSGLNIVEDPIQGVVIQKLTKFKIYCAEIGRASCRERVYVLV